MSIFLEIGNKFQPTDDKFHQVKNSTEKMANQDSALYWPGNDDK